MVKKKIILVSVIITLFITLSGNIMQNKNNNKQKKGS